jgi:uncharacterized protein
MLIEFFGENFGCFRDEFRLSMLATDIDPESERGIVQVPIIGDSEPLRLLRSVALYGPNASGKSTVLRAARSLRALILGAARFRSDERIELYEPFAGGKSAKQPVRLGLKAVIDGVVYDYETSFDERQVIRERLDQYIADRSVNLFHREKQEVTGEWTNDEQFKLIGRDFRPNALLLSLADTLAPALGRQIAPALIRLLRFYDASSTTAHFRWGGQQAARMATRDPIFRDWLLRQLKAADVGVSDLAVRRLRRVEQGELFLFEEVSDDTELRGTREPMQHRFLFTHSGPEGSFQIPYEDESYGTRKLINLAPILYDLESREAPVAAFVDEIGAALHPTLLIGLIQHVNCQTTAHSKQGQLIFATHETSLIDSEAKSAILRRDQVYFTEKLSSGMAKLYSLGEFKERQNINLRKRYLEGRYGAIPALGNFPE